MSALTGPIESFLRELCREHSDITEIWWIGSRANDLHVRPDSDWDFLVFARPSAFAKMRLNRRLEKNATELSIDLLVEGKEGVFRSVWGATKILRLEGDLKWRIITETKAKYWASKLKKEQHDDQPFQDEWNKFFDDHGADVTSQDLSGWTDAIRVWPPVS